MKLFKSLLSFVLAFIVALSITAIVTTVNASPPEKQAVCVNQPTSKTDVQNVQSDVQLTVYQINARRHTDEISTYLSKQPVLPTKPKAEKQFVQLE